VAVTAFHTKFPCHGFGRNPWLTTQQTTVVSWHFAGKKRDNVTCNAAFLRSSFHAFPVVNSGNGPAARIVSGYADHVRPSHVNHNKTKFETPGCYSKKPLNHVPHSPFLG
jgi:hypothetical protein